MENMLNVNSLADGLVYMTLSQATSQDARILKPAEQKLNEWETHAGFYTSLCVSATNFSHILIWLSDILSFLTENNIQQRGRSTHSLASYGLSEEWSG